MADAKTLEYYQKILDLIDDNEVILSSDEKVKNCERIVRLCDVLGSYKDCRSLRKKYERYALEEKEKGMERDYEACLDRFKNAHTADQYHWAEQMFRELGDYKEAEKMADYCHKRYIIRLGQKRLTDLFKGGLLVAFIGLLIYLAVSLSNSNPYQLEMTAANVAKGIRISVKNDVDLDEVTLYRQIYDKNRKQWMPTKKIEAERIGSYLFDTNVYPGTKYRYAIIASDTFVEPSYFTTIIRITTRDILSIDAIDSTSFNVRWSGSDVFTGYQLQYSTDNTFAKNEVMFIETKSRYSVVINNLKSGETYYVRVRSYHKDNDVTYYGGWSSTVGISLTSASE